MRVLLILPLQTRSDPNIPILITARQSTDVSSIAWLILRKLDNAQVIDSQLRLYLVRNVQFASYPGLVQRLIFAMCFELAALGLYFVFPVHAAGLAVLGTLVFLQQTIFVKWSLVETAKLNQKQAIQLLVDAVSQSKAEPETKDWFRGATSQAKSFTDLVRIVRKTYS